MWFLVGAALLFGPLLAYVTHSRGAQDQPSVKVEEVVDEVDAIDDDKHSGRPVARASIDSDLTLTIRPDRPLTPGPPAADPYRWNCACQPLVGNVPGLSPLLSIWNFLYSTSGKGTREPLTLGMALRALGLTIADFPSDPRAFIGNQAILKMFLQLNAVLNVSGRSSYFFKPEGVGRTVGVTATQAIDGMVSGVLSRFAFVTAKECMRRREEHTRKYRNCFFLSYRLSNIALTTGRATLRSSTIPDLMCYSV